MNKKSKVQAIAAGAKSEIEFALYTDLLAACTEIKKQLGKINKSEMRVAFEQLNGMILKYEFLIHRGRFFESQPLPKGFKRKKAKECYSNSFKLTLSQNGLAYCEGIVVASIGDEAAVPIDHGWCVSEDGKVIDVTLEKPGLAYYGAVYAKEEMIDVESLPLIYKLIEKQRE